MRPHSGNEPAAKFRPLNGSIGRNEVVNGRKKSARAAARPSRNRHTGGEDAGQTGHCVQFRDRFPISPRPTCKSKPGWDLTQKANARRPPSSGGTRPPPSRYHRVERTEAQARKQGRRAYNHRRPLRYACALWRFATRPPVSVRLAIRHRKAMDGYLRGGHQAGQRNRTVY